MSAPDELAGERIDALRQALDLAYGAPETEPQPAPEPGAAPPAPRSAKARAKGMIRRLLRPVVQRAAVVTAGQLAQRPEVQQVVAPGLADLRAHNEALRAEVAAMRAELQSAAPGLRELSLIGPGAVAAHDLADRLNDMSVNLQLLTAEIRGIDGRVRELGLAIAPAAGLEGAADRLAELRERVNAIDRRVRALPAGAPAAAAPSSKPEPSAVAGGAPGGGSLFDYVGFEARFRGDATTILDAQRDRYLALLSGHGPVLDVGCGRGELLEVLRDEGVAASGVDLNAEMVAEARGRGLDVTCADAVTHLRSLPEGSLGSIISVHVVEHLALDDLIELLELAASRLRPGGILVAETPNPASLIVLGNSYILDPTHVWPLHPSLLTFLCERAGFRSVEQRYFSEAEAYHLPRLDLGPDAPAWAADVDAAIEQLNRVLFGPQEYAVVAMTPPA